MLLMINLILLAGLLLNALIHGFSTQNVVIILLALILLIVNLRPVTSFFKISGRRWRLFAFRTVAYLVAAALAWGIFQLLPESASFRNLRRASAAYAMIGGKQNAAAIDILLEMEDDFPGSPAYYQNLAVAYMNEKEPEKARAALDRALQLNPAHYSIYYNYGLLLYKMENYPEALKYFVTAIDLNPGHTYSYIQAGAVCRQMNNLRRTIYYYQLALRFNRDSLTIRYALAKAYFDLDDFALAKAELTTILEQAPPSNMRQDAEVMLKELMRS